MNMPCHNKKYLEITRYVLVKWYQLTCHIDEPALTKTKSTTEKLSFYEVIFFLELGAGFRNSQ